MIRYSKIQKRMNSMYMFVGLAAMLTFASLASASEERTSGNAGSVNKSETCSTATLNGTYRFYSTGGTADGGLARVGIVTHDGKGNFTVRQHTSRNGKFESSKFSGRTEVAADCTTKSFTEDGHQLTSGIIVDDGNEVFLLNRTSGNTVVGVHKKIHSR